MARSEGRDLVFPEQAATQGGRAAGMDGEAVRKVQVGLQREGLHELAALVQRQGFGQNEVAIQAVEHAQPTGQEEGPAHIVLTQQAAEHRPEDEAQAEGGAQPGAGAGGQQAGGKADDADVVDAEFTEVKDKK